MLGRGGHWAGINSGVPIYANVAAFPITAATGALAVDASTGNLYEFNGASWVQIGGPSGALSLGNFDSQSATAKGLALVGGVLSAQSADATHPGMVNTTTQTFAGTKTFTSPIVGTQSQGDGSTKAASTSYVDVAVANAVAGVNPAVAVQAATTAASDTSGFTYNNGVSGIGATLTGSVNTAFTVDGFTFTALNQRVLVKNDTQSPSGAFNGIYFVTQVQTAILPPILTRSLDFDTPSDMNNTGSIPVVSGTVNGTTSWVLTSQIVTVGTTPLTFTQFTKNPAAYLQVSNNLSDVASKSTSFNNLSPMTTSGDIIYGAASGAGTRLGKGSDTNVLTLSGGLPVWAAPATSGTVTSVAATVPTFLSISGSPITSSGTLAISYNTGTPLPVANGGSGTITPFTQGSVLFAGSSGVYSQDNANFFWDATNKRHGILNASPAGSLDVSGAISATPSATIGNYLSFSASTLTDNGTSGSGTAAGATFNSIGALTLAATNSSVTTTAAYGLYLAGAPRAGSNETIVTSNALFINGGSAVATGTTTNAIGLQVQAPTGATNNYAAVFTGGAVGIGTTAPSSRLQIAGSLSQASWGLNGIGFTSPAATYTDTTTSGTVSDEYIHSLGIPVIAATNAATTITRAATLYIAGGPTAGANTTISNSYAIRVAGNGRFDGLNAFGGANPASVISIVGTQGSPSWTTTGPLFAVSAGTITANNGSGTVAQRAANTFGIPTLASANATTATAASTVYIDGAPVASGNTTITNAYSLYINGGASFFTGAISAKAGVLFVDPASANAVTIGSPSLAAGYTLTLPNAQGGASSIPLNDGSGNLSWASVRSGTTACIANTRDVAVVFSAMPNMNYSINATLVNTTDNNPDYQPIMIVSKTTTGFTAEVNNNFQTGAYSISWSVISYV